MHSLIGITRYRGGGDSFETASSGSEAVAEISEQQPTISVTDSSSQPQEPRPGYQWTLSDWGQRKRNNSGSVRVDLASPEDVTLDTDSTRVMFSTYGTTV